MATLLRRCALATMTAMALMLIAAPALAHHKDGHDGGKSEVTTTVVTEDNDDDGAVDYANTPDPAGDADNQHPSGNDRSEENGGSGNQGKSDSDPDGTENGGIDKVNGKGGNDLLDQDGNNGCGNDDDFEDDNNGNCGGKAKTKPPKPPKDDPKPPKPPKDDPKPPKPPKNDPPVVVSNTPPPTIVSGASSTGTSSTDPRPARRRGGNEAAPVVTLGADELPFTGIDVSVLVALMLGLALLGSAFVFASRRFTRA